MMKTGSFKKNGPDEKKTKQKTKKKIIILEKKMIIRLIRKFCLSCSKVNMTISFKLKMDQIYFTDIINLYRPCQSCKLQVFNFHARIYLQ
jgi:hypothetical protein